MMQLLKVEMEFVTLVLLAVTVPTLAQDDPQDIAAMACASFSSIYEFNSDDGYIESVNYPIRYPSSEDCQWYINPTNGIPDGQGLYLEVIAYSTEPYYDPLEILEGEGLYGEVIFVMEGVYQEGTYFYLGTDPVTLYFSSDSIFSYRGFRLYYYVGEGSPGQQLAEVACSDDTRPAYITHQNTTLIETIGYPLDHPAGTQCEWVITPDNAPEGLYLNVVYFYAYNYLYIHFAEDSSGTADTYWYGSLSNGYSLYVPGSVMTLEYQGHSSYPGFQLVYYPADPACTSGSASQVMVDGRGGIQSPGYPYDVPEHLSCRWLLKSTDDQKILLTSDVQDLYGDGVNCQDEYVEILDGDTVDALSLGKFCGNQSFGVIPSTGPSLQVYFRTHEESNNPLETHTGFIFSYDLII